jgi:hypothetical protein
MNSKEQTLTFFQNRAKEAFHNNSPMISYFNDCCEEIKNRTEIIDGKKIHRVSKFPSKRKGYVGIHPNSKID